ncbi:MAG: DUF2934 domain-containing protein [Planctomycetes bacterium]|nr:DUF2934 domain-containing protein [Planctomycetota bacterium]
MSNSNHAEGTQPTHEAIAARAYEIYLATGSRQGHCKQNWQAAEHELQLEDRAPDSAADAKSKRSVPHVVTESMLKAVGGGLPSIKGGSRLNA